MLQDEFQAPSVDFDPELEICAGQQTFGGMGRLINASFKAEVFEYKKYFLNFVITFYILSLKSEQNNKFEFCPKH